MGNNFSNIVKQQVSSENCQISPNLDIFLFPESYNFILQPAQTQLWYKILWYKTQLQYKLNCVVTQNNPTEVHVHLKSFVPLSVKTTIRVLGAALLRATTRPCVILSRESLPPSNDSNFKFAVARPNSWSENSQSHSRITLSPADLDIRCVKHHFHIFLDVRTVVIKGDKGVPEGQPHKGIISGWSQIFQWQTGALSHWYLCH